MSGLDEHSSNCDSKQEYTSADKHSEACCKRSADEIAANYAALTDNAPTGIIIIQRGKVVYANPYILRLMGYTEEELPHIDIWQIVHPEDRDRVKHHYLARMRGEESLEQYEFRVITKTGEIRHVELRATLIQYDGEPAVLDNIIDITDRKRAERGLSESEHRYRKLVDLSPDAIVVVCGGHVVFVNGAALSIYGASSADELMGRRLADLVELSERDSFAARLRSVLDGDATASLAAEVCFRKLDGVPFVAEVAAARIDYDGQPAVLAMIRDITERKKVEQHRRELKRQLEQHKRQFYRDTILSITNGKLDICEPREINSYICKARLRLEVRQPSEVSLARRETQAYCQQVGLLGERLESFMIGVGEAITNALKHAHGGRVYVGRTKECVWVGVADKGPGISSLILPRATLQPGYSTKPSLGMGYTIMLNVADRVLLKTGKRGTTILLIQNIFKSNSNSSACGFTVDWNTLHL